MLVDIIKRHRWNEGKVGLRAEAHRFFSERLALPPERVHYLDHHLAHAYSAVPNIMERGRTLIFTLDGVGDWKCATVNLFQDGKMSVLQSTHHRNSLGYYYGATTGLLGMKVGEHEFKVMGLAPYAKRQYYLPILEQLEKLLFVDDYGQWNSVPNPVKLRDSLELIYRFKRFDNIAGAIQEHTENLICRWIRIWVKKTGIRNIAVAGGVFMNVKASQKVCAMDCVDHIFVVPSASDESTALGCATYGALEFDRASRLQPLDSLYLGMGFCHADIEAQLNECHAGARFKITRPENINAHVASLLAEDKVVARCSGRMEFGARALGNRSILANPSNRDNVVFINDAIKARDFWMPFTPSILESDMGRYVVGHEKIFAPYMSITFQSTEEAQRDLKAAIHPKDRTLRPQCVRASWNPDYYEILSEFKRLTGIGGVLNTSFNVHGEPLVCSPKDAVHTLVNSGLDYLVIGPFLLRKR